MRSSSCLQGREAVGTCATCSTEGSEKAPSHNPSYGAHPKWAWVPMGTTASLEGRRRPGPLNRCKNAQKSKSQQPRRVARGRRSARQLKWVELGQRPSSLGHGRPQDQRHHVQRSRTHQPKFQQGKQGHLLSVHQSAAGSAGSRPSSVLQALHQVLWEWQ